VKLLAIAFCFPLLALDLNAKAAILMDGRTGEILFEENAHQTMYPASTCKIVTALCLLEEKGGCLDEVAVASREAIRAISPCEKKRKNYTTPSYWLEQNSSHIGIKAKEELSLDVLLHGLMLQSGNDAANVLAEHVDGSVPRFVERMNRRVHELGCSQTHFTNPHGLHHPEHVSSAYDLALMAREALKNLKFRKVVSTLNYERPKTNLQDATYKPQKNRLVQPGQYYYPGAIGGKTGGTTDGKCSLVAAAERDGRLLIAVVMGCDPFRETYKDVTQLFDYGFAQ